MSDLARKPSIATIIIMTALSILSLNMFLPSLGNIADDFAVSYATVNLSIAGYLVVCALLQIVMGPMSDRYGRRPVVLVGLVIFTVASLGCFLANDIYTFLVFRLIQAGVVAAMVIGRAVIRDMVPEQEAASMLGYVAMVMSIAPMIAPIVGGALDEAFGWRSNFALFVGLGLAVLALAWKDLSETNFNRSGTFAKQFAAYPELFRSKRFWGVCGTLTFSVGSFYVFLAGAPIVASAVFGLGPTQVGIGMGLISIGFFVGNFLSGLYGKTVGVDRMMLIGRLVALGAVFTGAVVMEWVVSNAYVFFATAIGVGLSNGLTLPSANAAAMSVRPQLAGSASGISGAMTFAGGALFSVITSAALDVMLDPLTLVIVLLAASVSGLLCAVYVLRRARQSSP